MISLWKQYSEDELIKLFNNSKTQKEFFKKMGYSAVNASIVKKIKEKYSWYDWKSKNSLVNKTFKELTVLREASKDEIQKYRPSIIGGRAWWTICSCGKELDYPISTYELQSGHTGSCGHLVYIREDLTGQRFGKLIVIKPEINNKSDGYSYCKCDCGNFVSIRNNSLKTGNTRSCGCILSKGEELISQILKEHNINFIPQKTFDNLTGESGKKKLSFDFYIPEFNLLIEYQGEQHYESRWSGEERFRKQKMYDMKKRQYCKENDLILKGIPYWDFDKIDYNYLFG